MSIIYDFGLCGEKFQVEQILCGSILYDSYVLLSAIAHQTSLSIAYNFRSEIDYKRRAGNEFSTDF